MKRVGLSLLLASSFVLAEDYEEDFSGGFDSAPIVIIEEAKEPEPFLDFSGSFTLFSSYSYKEKEEPFDGLSSLKSSLDLEVNKKITPKTRLKAQAKISYDGIYSINGRDKYKKELLDDEETTTEIKDLYISSTLSPTVDLKVGRQIVVWGKSDSLRVTDILNPMDQTKMGVVDIEDLRLQLFMTRVDFYFGNWSIKPIIIHENRFSKLPSNGSDFNFFGKINEEIPTDTQYALSANGQFEGYDISFYGAKVNSDSGHYDMVKKKKVHEPITMIGTAFNMTQGSFLYKAEFALFDGFKTQETADTTYKRTDYLLGFDYKGITDTTLSLETTVKKYNTFDPKISSIEEKTVQTAFRATKETLNATLTLNYLVSVFGDDFKDGGFQRVWAKYDFGGGLNTNFGVVDYIDDKGTNPLFEKIRDNDRVYADLKYSF